MLQLWHWIQRLRIELFQTIDLTPHAVHGAADLESAMTSGPRKIPSIWCIMLSEEAAPNQIIGGVCQLVTARIGIVIAIRNMRDATGDAARNDLEMIRAAVSDALLNWIPLDAEAQVTYVRGRLMRIEDSVLWWQDEYLTTYQLRKV